MLPRIYYDISKFDDTGIKNNGDITYARRKLNYKPKINKEGTGDSNIESPVPISDNSYTKSNDIIFLHNQISLLQKKLQDCEKKLSEKNSIIEKIKKYFIDNIMKL